VICKLGEGEVFCLTYIMTRLFATNNPGQMDSENYFTVMWGGAKQTLEHTVWSTIIFVARGV
jgi:hypothetical protein